MLLDRNLGNSAIAVLDAMADADEDRAELAAQRRADEQAELECAAIGWLLRQATPEALCDHMDTPTWRDALQALLDLVRGKAVTASDLAELRQRAIVALMPSALEATRGSR